MLKDAQGNPIINEGLWALAFANSMFPPGTLLITAGINGGAGGLFAEITATQLPGALPLFATGLGALGYLVGAGKGNSSDIICSTKGAAAIEVRHTARRPQFLLPAALFGGVGGKSRRSAALTFDGGGHEQALHTIP
jgi:hypothetical protein